jgi:glutathione S-transferase
MAQAIPSYSPDGEKEAIANACRTNLAQLYEVTGGSTFIAGENLTYLDFAYHELLDVLNWYSDGSFYEEFPNLKAYNERMVALYNPEYWHENAQLRMNGWSAKVNNY